MVDRVALVTGGTAGIGAASAQALLAAGYRVAANFGTNQAAARNFLERTGIPIFSWDVADNAACMTGVAKVEEAIGPIDVLVYNAGITRDAMLHKMDVNQWKH
jgi:acetoacetyl-CoA reductase